MSNIRGINDIRNNNRGNNRLGGFSQNMNFFGGNATQKNPEDETFWDMLHLNLCPQLVFYSFSVIFVILLTATFIVQISVDGIAKNDAVRLQQEFLPIAYDQNFTLYLMNEKNDIKEKYQVYRFLTSLFVHANFGHLLMNALMMIIWTSYFEIFLTSKKMPILFFLSGIIGNVFAVLLNGNSPSLGASTGIFGIMGCAIGYLIFNWQNLDYEGSPRFFWTCQVVFISLLSFLFTSSGVNTAAHFGGFIAGIFVGLFLCLRHEKPGGSTVDQTGYEKTNRVIGIFGSFAMFAICFSILMFN